MLFQLQYDSLGLNNYLINLLKKYFNNQIIEYRNIQAAYPIISIVFNDQTKVEIFVEIRENFNPSLLFDFHQPIHGVRKLKISQ